MCAAWRDAHADSHSDSNWNIHGYSHCNCYIHCHGNTDAQNYSPNQISAHTCAAAVTFIRYRNIALESLMSRV